MKLFRSEKTIITSYPPGFHFQYHHHHHHHLSVEPADKTGHLRKANKAEKQTFLFQKTYRTMRMMMMTTLMMKRMMMMMMLVMKMHLSQTYLTIVMIMMTMVIALTMMIMLMRVTSPQNQVTPFLF